MGVVGFVLVVDDDGGVVVKVDGVVVGMFDGVVGVYDYGFDYVVGFYGVVGSCVFDWGDDDVIDVGVMFVVVFIGG